MQTIIQSETRRREAEFTLGVLAEMPSKFLALDEFDAADLAAELRQTIARTVRLERKLQDAVLDRNRIAQSEITLHQQLFELNRLERELLSLGECDSERAEIESKLEALRRQIYLSPTAIDSEL